eukprot:CAMPEP_0185261604 /NCGR_PEP_ID=MMETSP1359-20130426/9951_1 /TAXON_ID=552665 /ORGANISM="Bigelowiella longifila, Strain CCMP242" /LENGTH=59 /DNA_ID=CAMNT_0027848273 /DNA_START=53 /DNA_END=228 /DNA_ORIENTATION=-
MRNEDEGGDDGHDDGNNKGGGDFNGYSACFSASTKKALTAQYGNAEAATHHPRRPPSNA